VKRFTILSLTATALAVHAAPATVATTAPAPAPTPVAYATPATDEAPLAPVSTQLLQNHPGAPLSIDDVLLVPSASAGQKGVAFQWGNPNNADAYILWDKYFAAAQYTGGADSAAKTIASFGLMNPVFGAGLAFAYADHYTEPTTTNPNRTVHQELSQAKLFGSTGWEGKDVYASLLWEKPTPNLATDPSAPTDERSDSVLLSVGMRKYPATDVEGLAWNGVFNTGYKYGRNDGSAVPNGETVFLASLGGQVGYVFISNGIQFLPGVDGFVNYANGVANPDYRYVFGASPYAAIILPLYEHLTLKGGARYVVEQTIADYAQGKPSQFNDNAMITNTQGSFGLRYEHSRWAVETQIGNGLLTTGPYFVSGGAGYNLFASLALTVNLK
jgi:hypothetical protein